MTAAIINKAHVRQAAAMSKATLLALKNQYPEAKVEAMLPSRKMSLIRELITGGCFNVPDLNFNDA